MSLHPLHVVATGNFATVALGHSVFLVFQALDVKVRWRLERAMEAYARDGPLYMPVGIFRSSEGRHPLKDGSGKDVQIQAFAHIAGAIRIYGACVTYQGKPHFLATEIDNAKKQRKANQAKLARSARYVGELLNER